MNETQVIASVRAGAADAFNGIVESYQQPIVRYLYRLTGDIDVAQDLAQDTFVNAYKSIVKTKAELSLKAWLYRIATNSARQYHRRKRLISFIPFSKSDGADIVSPHQSMERVDQRLDIDDALLHVPQDQRVCIVLHYVEGLHYKEIGDILGISEEAVRKRVARGSRDFREAYRAPSKEDTQ